MNKKSILYTLLSENLITGCFDEESYIVDIEEMRRSVEIHSFLKEIAYELAHYNRKQKPNRGRITFDLETDLKNIW